MKKSVFLMFSLTAMLCAESATDQNQALELASGDSANVESVAMDTTWLSHPKAKELLVRKVRSGMGDSVKAGDLVEVHYRGWLENGQEFDNSKGRGTLEFPLGGSKVIKGWDTGLLGMQSGEIRQLKVPSEMGYGDRDLGIIPPNSTLYFEVELVNFVGGLKPDTLKEVTSWEKGPRGIERKTEVEGTGEQASPGDKIKLHYTGWLIGGTQFATSKNSPIPAEFILGQNQVIQGWELGLKGVQKGQVLWMRIPPQLGYGGVPMANVPANSVLVFRVQVEDIEFSRVATDMPDLSSLAWQELRAGIKYVILAEGEGLGAKSGEKVEMHYSGWLLDGRKFDSSRPRGQTFGLTLGAKQVIPGWELGLEGMKVGEKRMLWIPANLGYGARGAGGTIPPNADLIFEVERVQ